MRERDGEWERWWKFSEKEGHCDSGMWHRHVWEYVAIPAQFGDLLQIFFSDNI